MQIHKLIDFFVRPTTLSFFASLFVDVYGIQTGWSRKSCWKKKPSKSSFFSVRRRSHSILNEFSIVAHCLFGCISMQSLFWFAREISIFWRHPWGGVTAAFVRLWCPRIDFTTGVLAGTRERLSIETTDLVKSDIEHLKGMNFCCDLNYCFDLFNFVVFFSVGCLKFILLIQSWTIFA